MGLGCALGRRGGRHGVEGQRGLGGSWCCWAWGVCGQRVASGMGRQRERWSPGGVRSRTRRAGLCSVALSRQGRQGGAPT